MGNVAKQSALHSQGFHIAIFTHCGGVPRQCAVAELLVIAEVVLTGGVGVFGVEIHTQAGREAMLPAD